MEFTASAELHAKLEHARNLLSHAVAPGDLGEIFERALDELIAKETKRRQGVVSDKPRKRRPLKEGSRHVPVAVVREVWNRDDHQCTFVDEHGRRCSERRYVTLEHVDPHARGGPPTAQNLCLLCKPHNLAAARREFGNEHIERKLRETRAHSKAARALIASGFKRKQVSAALDTLRRRPAELAVEELVRQALALLCPSKRAPRPLPLAPGEAPRSLRGAGAPAERPARTVALTSRLGRESPQLSIALPDHSAPVRGPLGGASRPAKPATSRRPSFDRVCQLEDRQVHAKETHRDSDESDDEGHDREGTSIANASSTEQRRPPD